MLFIDIQNSTDQQKIICEDVLNWYSDNFLFNYDFDITVLHTDLKDYSAVMHSTDELEFIIEININLPEEEYVKTLIHEMIHIEDYIIGDLTEENGKLLWKGKFYNEDEPWEIRADELEDSYYEMYSNTLASVCQVPI
jgi:hypothetical protein